MALLVVVVLGAPNIASAGQPSVSAPTGPQSGGVFTGTYTFATYISCSSGLAFNSSYSNSLEGTHTFAFYGAADGSLLVTIDGGGMMLVTSCGDPFTPPHTNVATYTVTKYAAGPSPTPTPSPSPTPTPTTTPTPTPPPSGGEGGSSGGGGAGSPSSSTGTAASPAPTAPDGSTSPLSDEPAPASGSSPSPAGNPIITRDTTGRPFGSPAATARATRPRPLTLAWAAAWLVSLVPAVIILGLAGSRRLREWTRRRLVLLRLRISPYWLRLRVGLIHRLRTKTPKVHGHDLPKRRGLSAHHHTGKLLAHHHTSYPALAFLLLLTIVLTAAIALATHADSALLTLTVTGPPPTTAATIDQPTDGEHVTTANQTIRGTCPSGVLVEVYRNGSFAGSTLCDINGLYAVLITLVPDRNDLLVRVADGLGQYGPDSATISVFYDAPTPTPTPSPTPTPPASPSPTVKPSPSASSRPSSPARVAPAPRPPAPPLLLTTAKHYQGASINEAVSWAVQISGGTSPYIVAWNWGDGTSTITRATAAGTIQQDHHYTRPGVYPVVIRVTDARHHEAVMQVVVAISGPTVPAITSPNFDAGNLIFIWPLLILTSLLVFSFWLGERHKLAMLRSVLRA